MHIALIGSGEAGHALALKRSRMLIIDCHGHYTTAPAAHQRFRDPQLARLKDLRCPRRARPISDDEIRETIETNQLKLQRQRGADLTIFSPRASAMGHHLGDEAVSLALDAGLQRSDQAGDGSVSGELRRRVPAAAVSGRADQPFDRRARALRE